jgi:hypothetical protein
LEVDVDFKDHKFSPFIKPYNPVPLLDLRINREMQELAFFKASVRNDWRSFNVRIAHDLWGGRMENTIGDLLQ